MKSLKAKLMATVAMLLTATVMLTSASFAWFTISTAPEVKGITAQVVTNENLEIAFAKGTAVPDAAAVGDTTKGYTWGNLVDVTTATSAQKTDWEAFATGNTNITLRPAGLGTYTDADKTYTAGTNAAAGNFYYPSYGTDGRVSQLTAMTTETPFTNNTNATAFGTLVGENSHVYGYYVDFWLRSNVGGQVTLATAVSRDGANNDMGAGSTFTASGTTAADKTLAANIRIAFRELGVEGTTIDPSTNAGTATPATISYIADATRSSFSGNVVSLDANQGKLVRMFVYLDGENVTNAAASIDNTTLGGTLNLQFAITAVNNAMDVRTAQGG